MNQLRPETSAYNIQADWGGPTVRSDIAKHCMQGLLASYPGSYKDLPFYATNAVKAADALIAELNKTQSPSTP